MAHGKVNAPTTAVGLKAKIERYWADRGYQVTVKSGPLGGLSSNTRNGLPLSPQRTSAFR